MAITIPSLPAASAAQLTDLIEVSQGGVSKKETLQQVADLIGGGSGNAQPNGGALIHDFSSSGDLVLTNPAQTLIYLTNASGAGHFVQFPAMNVSNSWQAGTTVVRIYNNTNQSILLKNTGGTLLYTLLAGFTAEINVISNSSANGSFGIVPYGAAAAKDVSNNALTNLVGMSGSSSANNLAAFFDTNGSIKDSGISSGNVLLASNNLNDVSDLETAQVNLQIIGAQQICFWEWYAPSANGAQIGQTTFTNYTAQTRQFLQSVSNILFGQGALPIRYQGSSPLTIQIPYFITTTSTTNFTLKVSAAWVESSSAMNVSLSTPVTLTGTPSGTANDRGLLFGTITPSGTWSSYAQLVIKIERDGSDSLATTVNVLPLFISFTSTTGDDS